MTAISLFIVPIAFAVGSQVPHEPPGNPGAADNGNTISFDLCTMLRQIGLPEMAATLVLGLSILLMLVWSFRNRPVRRVAVILSLECFAVWTAYNYWRIERCWSSVDFTLTAMYLLMCTHHLLPRNTRRNSD